MLEIEVVETNIIEGGIEVFARAWQDGIQIGFGKDGTVDVERFRFINPPVLVEDPAGDINRDYTEVAVDGTETVVPRRFREDPEEALLQSIEQTIVEMKNIHTDEDIIVGTFGNTTTTVYAEEDVAVRSGASTWAATRSGTGLIIGDDILFGWVNGGAYLLNHHFYRFDTSAIGSDTIDSATFSVYTTNTTTGSSGSNLAHVSVVEGTFADTGTLGTSDWSNLNSTKIGNDILISAVASGVGYKVHTLNASGEAIINGSGKTKIARRPANDFSDATAPTGLTYTRGWQFEETTGTSQDPRLVVEHSSAATRRVFHIS